jgi:hypothetical protein
MPEQTLKKPDPAGDFICYFIAHAKVSNRLHEVKESQVNTILNYYNCADKAKQSELE